MKNVLLVSTLALFLAGCARPATPAPVPTDTQTPWPSPTFAPTLTPIPTFLFGLTPGTSTPTAPSATPTSAGSSSDALSCNVLMQSIRNGHRFDPKERFDMAWKVRNNGTAAWDPGGIDFTYFSGARMLVSELTPLQTSVAPGATVALLADMVAPKYSGRYTTVWTLRQGNDDFCHVSLSIRVR